MAVPQPNFVQTTLVSCSMLQAWQQDGTKCKGLSYCHAYWNTPKRHCIHVNCAIIAARAPTNTEQGCKRIMLTPAAVAMSR